jgi:hypothetical protein
VLNDVKTRLRSGAVGDHRRPSQAPHSHEKATSYGFHRFASRLGPELGVCNDKAQSPAFDLERTLVFATAFILLG